ncbi:MAG TPA: hypothetical protein VK564_07615 [Thermodesulfobacteriota bacterium]|nr:hypothetical protein [Thermodesulfobacteriota bacterium]
MIKKTILLSTLLSLSLAFGCAEFEKAIKDTHGSKEEKAPKAKQQAETPKEAVDTTAKESAPAKDTATKTAPATKSSGSGSSGSVFGPK